MSIKLYRFHVAEKVAGRFLCYIFAAYPPTCVLELNAALRWAWNVLPEQLLYPETLVIVA